MTTQQQLKGKSKGQRAAITKITSARIIEEETEELGEKPLRHPPSGKIIHQRIKLGYMNSNRPSKPYLPDAPKPSKLLTPTRLNLTVSSLAF